MRKKKIKIPIYFGDLIIIQVKSLRKIEKKYKIDSLHGYDACCFRDNAKNGYNRYVLAFTMGCNAGAIAHESMHLLSMIFKDRGILFEGEGNDEHQCYLLGWIVAECHKFLKVKKYEKSN